MRVFLLIALFFKILDLNAQSFTTNPAFPVADQPLTLTINVTGVTSLEDESDLWLWAWLPECSSNCDAPSNIDPATSAADAAKLVATGNTNEYSITFTPTSFFNKPADEISKIGFLVKAITFEEGQTGDLFIDISTGELAVNFSNPTDELIFIDSNQLLSIQANSSKTAQLTLFIDNVLVITEVSATTLEYNHNVTESGLIDVRVEASLNGETVSDEFKFLVRSETPTAQRPTDIAEGINYFPDASKATFCLFAPGKNSVYLVGDFNNWLPSTDNLLSKDGDYFWITISGLTSQTEYAFQYLVDESIQVGDPYSDKILDPVEDGYVDSDTYPNLKSYPDNPFPKGWVSVMQTGQQPYNWATNDFVAPDKENLIIYELLVRDFDEKHNYQAIINRLDYLQELGINAIELMPIMEFDGNLSWGYNPAFYFAPDKYYGTKNKLKVLIDECHARGIAVILDMVLNQTHEKNPLAKLYWDDINHRPSSDNPWLNQETTHPFSVFYDFNHESKDTQHFVDTVNYYWLNEYRFDGFRFDLSKGFTQKVTGNDVSAWSAYDQSRIDILERMADKIWEHHPNAYVILEHLADNSEEKVLANYGMMLWGNMNYNFNQNTMGYEEGSNIDWAYSTNRDWNQDNLVAYMESHDEERLVYRNLNSGNVLPGRYSTKELNNALDRIKSVFAIYYAIPGPKMLWQFGELGYDISIEQNGRTGNKPIPWADNTEGLDYDTDIQRQRLYNSMADIIDLKKEYQLNQNFDFIMDESQTLIKLITLDGNFSNPTSEDESSFMVVANFNLEEKAIDVEFPYTGTWYSYFAQADELEVDSENISLTLQPGEFRIYSNVSLPVTEMELNNYVQPNAPTNLGFSEIAGTGLEVNWIDNSLIETNFDIYRSQSSDFKLVGTVSANTMTFTDTSVLPNTNYSYKIAARNANYSSSSIDSYFSTTSIITSINNPQNQDIVIYPNPTKEYIYIKGMKGRGSIYILDHTGRKVLETEHDFSSSNRVDLAFLKPGLYILKIKGKQIVNKLFMKE